MRRRDFIKALAAAATLGWPHAVRAQKTLPIVGFLASGTRRMFDANFRGFVDGLKDAGFVDGETVSIDYRFADGHFDRLPAMAAELVQRPAKVLFAAAGNVSAQAARRATSTIPIVFVTADDPVATGLVASLSRPGANMTGVARLGTLVLGKNLELIDQLLPAVSVVGVLVNPKRPTADLEIHSLQEAAKGIGKSIRVLRASDERDIGEAFRTIAAERIGALIVAFDSAFNSARPQIIELAAQHALPTAYFTAEFVTDGGLMSYGSDPAEAYKLGGDMVARILKGANPADLPVRQVTKLELALNLKTAKSLGLKIPVPVLGRADTVIE